MINASTGSRRIRNLTLTCVIVVFGSLNVHACAQTNAAGNKPRAKRPAKAEPAGRRLSAAQWHAQWQRRHDAMVAAGLREAHADTDVLHCDLQVEFFLGAAPEEPNLVGTNIMTVESKTDGLTTFTFRLDEILNIDQAMVNGTPVSVSTLSPTTRQVSLDQPYNDGEVFILTISYSGHAVGQGPATSIAFKTHGIPLVDIVYTCSVPYFAFTWWPIKDSDYATPGNNCDKFTVELAITGPADMVSVCNGELQSIEDLPDDRRRYNWSHTYPIAPYLVFFSSTNYNTWSVDYEPVAGGTMPVRFYIFPEKDTAGNRAAWEKALDALYVYRQLFGEYPFVNDKYGIYQCKFGGFAGMEHQTCSGHSGFSAFDETLTVHELSHSWWGNMITCATLNHMWLNEGFATYCECLWEENKTGTPNLSALKSCMNGKKYTGPGTVYVSDEECADLNDLYDGDTSYNKGAWVLHMLRHVLGDGNFYDALAAYRAAYEFGCATTEQFQAVCESFYDGGDLGWFFDQWIYEEGAPAYSWGWDWTELNANAYLLLHVQQTQSSPYPVFTMPIDMQVDQTTHTIFNDAQYEHFVIPIAASPGSVQFDLDKWVLWSARTNVAYQPGPPKIVHTRPAPGSEAQPPNRIYVTFHTDVVTDADDYSLTSQAAGPLDIDFDYDSETCTTTLSTADALPSGDYTVTVSDNVTAVDSGQALDGEIGEPPTLPSGDGLPLGPAVFDFTVPDPACTTPAGPDDQLGGSTPR